LRTVLRIAPSIDEQDFERAMLRKCVDALSGDAHRCADCGRAPLIGETLYSFGPAATVCELCRPLRDGVPDASMRVRSSEYGHAVRIHHLKPA